MTNSKSWIIINDYETNCKLGVYPKEQIGPQRIILDVKVEVITKTHNDDIKKVLSYEEIINVINNVTKQNHKYLAETVAEEIARRCLEYKDSISAHVTLKKPDIIKGKTVVGVEIYLEN